MVNGRSLIGVVACLAALLTAGCSGTDEDCGTVQRRVDDASSGDTVDLPDGCVYREEVTVDKSITLVGGPGVEIRGSDVWADWTEDGDGYWTSKLSLDDFPTKEQIGDPSKKEVCEEGTDRCKWPEQVFLDGEPLEQVEADPELRQFAVDDERRVVLADNPLGRIAEVTTRRFWVRGEENPDGTTVPDAVTVEGFAMKHAANGAQTGAIDNEGYGDWTIRGNDLSWAHGVVVSLGGGPGGGTAAGLKIVDNDIHHGGQMGVSGARSDLEVVGNRVHDNNTEGFERGWAAGGIKIANSERFVAEGNEVQGNAGTGIWIDVDAEDVTLSDNRVHHNYRHGVRVEITRGVEISDNVLWENGQEGRGSGISATNSRDVEIRDNILAWNRNGITVQDSCRADKRTGEVYPVTGVLARGNTVLAGDSTGGDEHLSLAWRSPEKSCRGEGTIHEAASGNGGENNRYWFPSEEGGSGPRFNWEGGIEALSGFNATPGEEGGRYLSDGEKDEAVAAGDIPAKPESR